ncbi:MAG: hypothetical protein Q7W45_05720 [Bacteroidota bacterium]|nr:hypothetical protein [Bacteroidota bacterium]MDP3144944.1 hypothetical protein [Bacteroidota bacterium]MDP3557043.1 hypothetical protein [Bacteroidota bacterium]
MSKYKYHIDGRSTAKGGLITLTVFLLIFIGVFIFFYINYDSYSETVFSVRKQRNIERGLAPSIIGWGIFVIPFTLFGIFALSMTRNFKQISCGIAEKEILFNTSMIKETIIPISNINEVKESEHIIEITLKDYSKLIQDQFFLFRGIVKKKYVKKQKTLTLIKSEFEENKGSEVAAFLLAQMNKS